MQRLNTLLTLSAVLVISMVVAGILVHRLAQREEEILAFYGFEADVTVPVGHRCMGILPEKAREVADPLRAKGFVLQGGGLPIVCVGVDWCEIRNDASTRWREVLAKAAGTRPDRVLLWSNHQHDAPVMDLQAQRLLTEVGLDKELCDPEFHEAALQRVAAALRAGRAGAVPLTHLGFGESAVERIGSSRRVAGSGGRVRFDRGSRSGADPELAAAPEGLIDPQLRCLSFWSGDRALAALHSYATHPMSRYGEGVVSSDFVGLARERLQAETPETLQIYASGCSGDVTAGKYNDGSPETRLELIGRLHQAMRRAWEGTRKVEVRGYALRRAPVLLPFRKEAGYGEEALGAVLQDGAAPLRERILAAMGLSALEGRRNRIPLEIACLDLGAAQVALFPAESFVGYQLLAQRMRPGGWLLPIGYGECWPGYIPFERDFEEGFTDDWLWVDRGSELAMRRALWQVLPTPAADWQRIRPGGGAEDIRAEVFAASEEHPRISEGAVAVLSGGKLLCAVTEFSGGAADDAAARIVARESDDGGRTWGAPRVLQENVGERNVMSVSLLPFRTPEQSGLGLFYLVKNGPSDLQVWMRVSADEGATFGDPVRVSDGEGYHVMNNDRARQLTGGRLVCPVAWTPDLAARDHFVSFCYLSDDGGRTWRRGAGEADLPQRGAMEPEVIECRDGSLRMFLRTQLGEIWMSRSTDGGETWGPPAPAGLASPESPATVRRAPRTGDWLLVWNPVHRQGEDHGGKRWPLAAARSPDEGQTWTAPRILEEEPGRSYAYTSLTFQGDRALLTYYVRDDETGRIGSRFRSLPVDWFYGRAKNAPQAEDLSGEGRE